MTKQPMMAARHRVTAALMAGVAFLAPAAFAAGGGDLLHSGANVNDQASLQRGAQLYMNYCSGCHSANYMRYKRLADDLGLSEEAVLENFVYGDKKIGDTMSISMQAEDAEAWFGKAPPDLSVTGRSRGPDWIYTYLLSFYQDEFGEWNNTLLQNAAMPHVLWQLQGIQKPVYKTVTEGGMEQRVIDRLELVSAGSMTEEEYRVAMRDLAAYMDYMGEPAQLKRKSIGVWVLVYLAIFTFIAYLLKREFWRDVH